MDFLHFIIENCKAGNNSLEDCENNFKTKGSLKRHHNQQK